MIYGKVAKRLAEKGYSVTPLKGKVPVISGWETTRSKNIVTDKKYDNFNIGLLCGEPSGLIVADIDTPDKILEQKLYALMPETPVMKKGKKGINFFYRYDGEETIKIHNPINTRRVEFELISTGRQTVIPKSIHPESKTPYIWCDKAGEHSKNHLINIDIGSIPYLSKDVIQEIKKCINDHFEPAKQEILEKKASVGIAGLIENYDKLTHKDLPDYNPKNLSDIEEGYRDRSRSGSHDSIVKYMMALISKGENKESVIQAAMKYDQDYNIGYSTTYFNCRTCKARGETAYQKAEYYYESSKSTIVRKKEENGEEMPVESSIIVSDAAKEMDAVHNVLCGFGIKYDNEFHTIPNPDTINLMKEGKRDFFIYDGKKWILCQQPFNDSIYRRFNTLFAYKKTHNNITAAISKFVSYIPNINKRHSFFKINPKMANFANGTLHLNGLDNKTLEFKPHNRLDYCTDIINLDYGTNAVNEMFEDMLTRITEGDMEKYYAIQEMFALAIMPLAARIYFLYGVSGSGKSTLGKIMQMLIGLENFSGVDPSSFDGFNMESMVNKKVNMDMDISIARPISDGQFKKIEDGAVVRIRRKGKEDIYASTPWLHIFGANSLPKNFDGASGAYARRVTIIRFNKSFTENGAWYDRDFAEKVFKHSPEGILNFAIKGLQRLIDNKFVFTVPKSGVEAMDKWTLENDTIGLFLKDLEMGDVSGVDLTPVMREDLSMNPTDLWSIFRKWKEEVGKNHSKLGRNKFYEVLQEKGFELKRTSEGRTINGIGYENISSTIESANTVDYSAY